MPVTPARRIAFDVLRRVEAEGAYASDVLHAELGASGSLNFKSSNFKSEDAALATELALGVLRQRRLLDFILARQLKKPVEKLDLPVLLALRMGLYQLRFLERIPARAAVNESVELVKLAKKFSAATLVNAVLRRAADEAHNPAEEFLPQNLPLADRLGILHSHPTWIVERWLARLGETQTVTLLEANNRTPRLACAVHTQNLAEALTPGGPPSQDDVFALLEKSGLRIEPGLLLKNAFAVSGGSPTGFGSKQRVNAALKSLIVVFWFSGLISLFLTASSNAAQKYCSPFISAIRSSSRVLFSIEMARFALSTSFRARLSP